MYILHSHERKEVMENLKALLQNSGLSVEQIMDALKQDAMRIIPEEPTLGMLVAMGLQHDYSLENRAPDDDRHEYPNLCKTTLYAPINQPTKPWYKMYTSGHTDKTAKDILEKMRRLYQKIYFYNDSEENKYKEMIKQYSIFDLHEII
jgi:hypothetical protein